MCSASPLTRSPSAAWLGGMFSTNLQLWTKNIRRATSTLLNGHMRLYNSTTNRSVSSRSMSNGPWGFLDSLQDTAWQDIHLSYADLLPRLRKAETVWHLVTAWENDEELWVGGPEVLVMCAGTYRRFSPSQRQSSIPEGRCHSHLKQKKRQRPYQQFLLFFCCPSVAACGVCSKTRVSPSSWSHGASHSRAVVAELTLSSLRLLISSFPSRTTVATCFSKKANNSSKIDALVPQCNQRMFNTIPNVPSRSIYVQWDKPKFIKFQNLFKQFFVSWSTVSCCRVHWRNEWLQSVVGIMCSNPCLLAMFVWWCWCQWLMVDMLLPCTALSWFTVLQALQSGYTSC